MELPALAVTAVFLVVLLAGIVNATFSDIEGDTIAVPVDNFSWPQVGLVGAMWFILVVMWLAGMLPVPVSLDLSNLADRRGGRSTSTFAHTTQLASYSPDGDLVKCCA